MNRIVITLIFILFTIIPVMGQNYGALEHDSDLRSFAAAAPAKAATEVERSDFVTTDFAGGTFVNPVEIIAGETGIVYRFVTHPDSAIASFIPFSVVGYNKATIQRTAYDNPTSTNGYAVETGSASNTLQVHLTTYPTLRNPHALTPAPMIAREIVEVSASNASRSYNIVGDATDSWGNLGISDVDVNGIRLMALHYSAKVANATEEVIVSLSKEDFQ